MALTTTDFLKDVRQRGQIPSLTTDGITAPELEVVTDEGLLRLASGELRTWMAPKLLESRGEWLVASQDFTLSSARSYRIPSRAVGGSLRALYWLPSGTVEQVQLSHVDAGEEARVSGDFKVEGGKVVLLNPNITSGTLRMGYHLRPSTLVLPTRCGQVETVTTALTQTKLTLSSTTFNALTPVGTLVDVAYADGSYDILAASQAVAALFGTTSIFFAGTTLASLIPVGAWVSLVGETCVLPLPEDWWELFAQRVAARALEVAGLAKEAKAAYDTLDGLLEGLAVVTSRERVQSSRRKVRNTSMWGG